MVKVFIPGLIKASTKDNGLTIKEREKEFKLTATAQSTKVNGLTIGCTEKAFSLTQKE